MPTALPNVRARRAPLTARQTARLLWLNLRFIYLTRRMERVTARYGRVPSDRDGGKLVRAVRRWLAVSAQIADLLGEPEPPEAVELRAIGAGRAAEHSGGSMPGGCASRPDRGRIA